MVALIVVVVLVAGAVLARRIFLNDQARPVDPQEALDRFRASTTDAPLQPSSSAGSTTTMPSRPLATTPLPGVYVYATEGRETIDSLGGTAHDYPAQTTVTVTPSGCGVQLRWDLLKERYEEFTLCATPEGIELQPEGANYHEFFGVGQREPLRCNRQVLVVPADGEPREIVPLACTLADDVWLPEWEVLGPTVVEVDGVDVDATYVRMRIEDDDEYWEHTVVEWWLDDHGLPLRMTATKSSKSPTDLVGDVVYTETFDARLESLTPLQ